MQQGRDVGCTILSIDLAAQSLIGTSSLPFAGRDKELAIMDCQCRGIPFGGNESPRFRIGTQVIKHRNCIGTCIRYKQAVPVGSDCQRDRKIAPVALLWEFGTEIKDVAICEFNHCHFVGIGQSNVEALLVRTEQKRRRMRSSLLNLCRSMKLNHALQLPSSEIQLRDTRGV